MYLYSNYTMCELIQDSIFVVIRRIYTPILVSLRNGEAVHIYPWTYLIIRTAVYVIEWLLFSETRTNLKYILRDVSGNYSLQVT